VREAEKIKEDVANHLNDMKGKKRGSFLRRNPKMTKTKTKSAADLAGTGKGGLKKGGSLSPVPEVSKGKSTTKEPVGKGQKKKKK
jgi:hypothetical protein